jgi:hypothetical protein
MVQELLLHELRVLRLSEQTRASALVNVCLQSPMLLSVSLVATERLKLFFPLREERSGKGVGQSKRDELASR